MVSSLRFAGRTQPGRNTGFAGTSGSQGERPLLNWTMTERQRQTEFLKELMQSQDCQQCRELETRICQAERDEHCICSAISIAVCLAVLSLLGLGYSAVLAGDAGATSSITTLKFFTATLLASLIWLAGSIGFLYSSRRVTNRLYHECRAFLRARQSSQAASPRIAASMSVPAIVNPADANTESDTQMPPSSKAPAALVAREPVPVLAE